MADPESVGNQSREECEEGIERMMAEKTAEERRARRSLKRARLQSDVFTVGDTTAYVEAWVRAVVAAQKEKDASVDPTAIACPSCHAASGSSCRSYTIVGWRYMNHHDDRWRAAIRQSE